MQNKFKNKKKKKKGFTLAETLIAVLILMMVSAIVAAGVPVAANAYRKVVVASNAETLLSTTILRLRNELGSAKDITVYSYDGSVFTELTDDDNDGKIMGTALKFYNMETGYYSKIYLESGDSGSIMYQRYVPEEGIDYNEDVKTIMEESTGRLVSAAEATDGLCVTYSTVTYSAEDSTIVFADLAVESESNTAVGSLPKRDTFTIRLLK